MAKRQSQELLISKIIDQANYRTQQDIDSWRHAITIAEDIYNPSRVQLMRIYDEVILDTHVQGVLQQRINNILRQDFRIINDSGEDNANAKKLFDRQWFYKFLTLALESRPYGHSLIQLWDITPNGYSSVQIIPRKNVVPNKGWVMPNENNPNDHIFFREAPYASWLVEVGEPDDFGLFVKAAPSFILKKNALLQWAKYTEIFGMPLRVGYTKSRTQEGMNKMAGNLRKMGTAAYGVFQEGEDVKFVESTRGDAFNVYDKLIERCNSELSKLIVGQTMTTDNGSSKSQSEVHERVSDGITDSDKRFISFVINDKLIPLMISHGFALKGLRFEWAANIDTDALFDKTIKLLQYKDVPDEFIEKTFGIPAVAKPVYVAPEQPTDPNEDEPTDGKPSKKEPSDKGEKKKTDLVALSSFYQCKCPKCGGTKAIHLASEKPNHKTVIDIDALARHIYENQNEPDKIHIPTFLNTAEHLMNGFSGGFEKQGAKGVVQGYKQNLFAFSAAKTFTEMNIMREALHDGEQIRSFGDFKKAISAAGIQFNRHTETEYNYCVAAGQMADRWQTYKADAKLYPKLRYVTAGDGRVREQHARWDNLVLPLTHPFWRTNYPPNDWGCRCDAEQEDEDTPTTVNFQYDEKSVPLFFRNNVGESQVVFNPDVHPYFTGLSDTQKQAADNIVKKITDGENITKHKQFQKVLDDFREEKREIGSTNENEAAAIYGYSTNQYTQLNAMLRGKPYDKKLTEYLKQYETVLNNALDSLETYAGVVKRGIVFNSEEVALIYKNAFEKGTTVVEKAFTSTSYSDQQFAGKTQLSIVSKRGKIIEKYSHFENEREVLFKSNTEFKVLDYWEENGTTYINLEEV